MGLELYKKKSFKKDMKRIKNSLYDKQKEDLKIAIETLMDEKEPDMRYFNHPLKGNKKGLYDCHISPDLVLIYEIDKKNKRLILVRIGSHSELF